MAMMVESHQRHLLLWSCVRQNTKASSSHDPSFLLSIALYQR